MSDYEGTYTDNLNLSMDNENDSYSVDRVNANTKIIDAAMGLLSALKTTDKNSLVEAINEVLASEGTLSSLTTATKTSLVLAINEIMSNQGALSSLNTSSKTSLVVAINELLTDLGTLSSLTTTSKTNLVAAINELLTDIGVLSSLTTTVKGNLVAAINEITTQLSENTQNITTNTANISKLSNPNTIINGDFRVNQRAVSGTVTLAANAYGHDRWKAGASGCTYTFATSGGVTTITITAGSLIQVIEGTNLQTGTYVLSWSGTATGKIGTGSYSASGVTASVTGGTNLNIEFGIGTLSNVKFEKGTLVTPFVSRSYAEELVLCQRYYERIGATLGDGGRTELGVVCGLSTTSAYLNIRFQATKRVIPSFSQGGSFRLLPGGVNITLAISDGNTRESFNLGATGTGLIANSSYFAQGTDNATPSTNYIAFDAEIY